MKRNLELLFLDILFVIIIVYGIYRYMYETNNRVIVLRLSLLLFAYITYEHYRLFINQKRIY